MPMEITTQSGPQTSTSWAEHRTTTQLVLLVSNPHQICLTETWPLLLLVSRIIITLVVDYARGTMGLIIKGMLNLVYMEEGTNSKISSHSI